MSQSKTLKMERFFDRYSKNLRFYYSQAIDVFICPLCLRDFPRSSIYSKDLTIEHIIPSSIGGKLETMTCKACNNQHGTNLDAHFVRRTQSEDILVGESDEPLSVRIQIGKGEFGAELYLSHDEPKIEIVGIPRISNPELYSQAIKELKSGNYEIQIKGSLQYQGLASRIAVLRMAYLMMFHYFGYGYILCESVTSVRNQIIRIHDETDVLNGLLQMNTISSSNVVSLMKVPEHLKCFLVLLNVSTKIDRNIAVVMPGLDSDSDAVYQKWAEMMKLGTNKIDSSVDIISYDSEYISDQKYILLPTRIWQGSVEIG